MTDEVTFAGITDEHLAALIARAIFKTLDMNAHTCHRIEGKAIYNGKEIALGGLAEQPLAAVIEVALTEHRSY